MAATPRRPALVVLWLQRVSTEAAPEEIRERPSMALPQTIRVALYWRLLQMVGEQAPVQTVAMGVHPGTRPQVAAVRVYRSASRGHPPGMEAAVVAVTTAHLRVPAGGKAVREAAVMAAREGVAAAVSRRSEVVVARAFHTPVAVVAAVAATQAVVTDMAAAAVLELSSSVTHSNQRVPVLTPLCAERITNNSRSTASLLSPNRSKLLEEGICSAPRQRES